MDTLRRPLFVLAVILIAVVVVVEAGSEGLAGVLRTLVPHNVNAVGAPPGFGVRYLALLDALVLFTVALIGIALIIPERVQGRLQGVLTLLVSLLTLLGAIGLVFVTLGALILMVTLLLAPIFGTIAYFAIYGHFDRSDAAILLSWTMITKLCFAGCLFFAQQRFLRNKGLVLLVLTSLLGNVIVSWLHGFVPGFLVSITDAIAGIVVAILAALWALFLLIGSLVSIIKAIRLRV